VVSQELSLFGDLDVLANLFVTAEPTRLGLVDRAEMARRARPVLAELGLADIPLNTKVGELDLARRQLLEICRALLGNPHMLILDEPSSALPAAAVERLHAVVRGITARGVAVLYVSHFLEEVTLLADRITILRDGRNVRDGVPTASLTVTEMVTAMVGAAPAAAGRLTSHPSGGAAIELDDITVAGRLEGVSLTARSGEVVGLAGLQGAGHHTVLDLLWGRAVPASGSVRLPDGGGRPQSTAEAVRRRIAFVPGDRKGLGLMLDATVAANITSVGWLARRDGGFLLRPARAAAIARRHIADLRIRATPGDVVGTLSGGNQQKVVFAKWLQAEPAVMLLDDPTRGVDVRAKAEMHQIVRGLAAAGKVVLMCSTDPAELAEVSDRVVVFRRGHVTTDLSGDTLTEHTLLHAINAMAG
jgi:ribose transport system ATP-binding protein